MSNESASVRQIARYALASLLLAAMASGPGSAPARADDLIVVSGPAMARVLTDLRPRIEALTGRALVIEVAPSPAIARRLSDGARFDAAVVYEPAAVALLKSGRLAAERLSCIGWTRLGVATSPRSGAPAISTVALFRRALLAARSIGYNAADASGAQFRHALTQMGVLGQIDAKLVDLGPRDPLAAVADGTVGLGVAYVGEIAAAPGVRSLGELPWQVQQLTPIYAAVARDARGREAARRLVAYMSSFEATAVLTRHQMDITPNE